MKRILRLLLLTLPLLAGATEIPEKDWEYERLDDDHVVIRNPDQSRRPSAIDQSTAGDIVVPSTLRSMQVVSIGEKAFYGCSKLTSVKIPEGVTNIADNAFYGCSSLTNVVFPTSLKSIGTYAFKYCSKLSAVNITGASLAIGSYAFDSCSSVGDLAFSGDLISIGDYAFSDCTGLRDVSLSSKVVQVGDYSFQYRSALGNLTISGVSISLGVSSFSSCSSLSNAVLVGSSSASIADSAFSSCSKLQAVVLPEALTDVATNVFYRCSALESIAFPSNVTHVSYRAFDTCTSLKTIKFSEGLTGIDAQAFYGCSSLTNLVFPQSLKTVGDRAFECCSGLEDVRFSEGNANLSTAVSVKLGERAFYQCDSVTNVFLSQAVSSIGSRAFSQCEALSRVNLPTNFTDIAESTFEDCSSLKAIDLPVTLETVGNTAFFGCTNLTTFLIPTNNTVTLGTLSFKNTKYWNDYPSDLVVNNGYILGFKGDPTDVTLPDGCKAIPVAMFEGMTTLRSVTIPDSVTEIGARAFNGCSGITNLAFNSVTTIGNSAFEGCTSLACVSFSDGLTTMPGNCFKGCSSLTGIKIPNGIQTIGEYAFYCCTSLTNVVGGGGVTTVGDSAFAWCTSLQPFRFSEGVTYGDHVFQGVEWTENVLFPSIGTLKDEYPTSYLNIRSVVLSSSQTNVVGQACAGCRSLEWIVLPDHVASVGSEAFKDCISLTSVVFNASLSNVADRAFANCPSVSSVVTSGQFEMQRVFPDAYARIANITLVENTSSLCSNAFAGCSSLLSFELGSTVTGIGSGAFSGCTGFKSAEIPDNVKSIGDSAFANCTALTNVAIRCVNASIGKGVFAGCPSVRTVSTATSLCFSNAFPEVHAKLTSVKLLDGVSEIVASAFEGCGALTSMKLPTSVTSIGALAFAGCTNLPSSIVIPAAVASVGDYAFKGCANLTRVNYFGSSPSVTSNLYVGTSTALWSGVLKDEWESWGGEAPSEASALRFWPVVKTRLGGRRLVVWGPTDEEYKAAGMMKFYLNDGTGTREIKVAVEGLGEEPVRENYEFRGWYSKPYGAGTAVTAENASDFASVYAYWVGEDEDPSEYDFTRAHKYVGAVLDGETVIGSVQVSFAKGKTNRTTEETTAAATAKVLVLGEGQLSMKGTLSEDGTAELANSRSTSTLSIEIDSESSDLLTGTLDGYDVVACRDLTSSSLASEKTRASAFFSGVAGKYVAALQADGGTAFTAGFATLSVDVSAKGVAKVSGYMPDGTKVSASSQLALTTDEGGSAVGCAAVVVPLYAKKGGFAFRLTFENGVPYLSGLSPWISDKSGTEVPLAGLGIDAVAGLAAGDYSFSADITTLAFEDVDIETSLSPDGTAFSATERKWSLPKPDTVKFDKDEGYVIKKDNGNPAALKLTYTAKTGLFNGSFKIYGVTSAGRAKTCTATVRGCVLGGMAFGTATVKKVGSLPVGVDE